MKAIEVKNLTRTFGHVVAVDHISFEVEEGEIFGFLGANGAGLIIAAKLSDTEGFRSIMNLIIMPIFFLSGAFFPLQVMPAWVKYIMYIDPLTYGVDGLRGALVGGAALPLWLDFVVLGVLSIALAGLGAYLFSKMEAD